METRRYTGFTSYTQFSSLNSKIKTMKEEGKKKFFKSLVCRVLQKKSILALIFRAIDSFVHRQTKLCVRG